MAASEGLDDAGFPGDAAIGASKVQHGDADNLVNLDADPDVMRFVTGGISTSREEIQNEFLPAFLAYYQRYEGFGFWAAIEKATGEFLGGSISGRVRMPLLARSSLLPVAQVSLGEGYATEGSRALIRKGFTDRCAARDRGSDGGQRGLSAGHGEGGPDAGADLPSALALSHRRRPVRRRGVCTGQPNGSGDIAAGSWPPA